MKLFVRVAFLAFVWVFSEALIGCSSQHPGGIQIILKNENPTPPLSALFDIGVLSTPSATTDFNCFAVNVTGLGVPSMGADQMQCSSTDGFHGHGMGILSKSAPLNTPINLLVPSGRARRIDAYGVYPPDSNCGGAGGVAGGGSGYYLGTAVADLLSATTVTVLINYAAGTGPSVACTSLGGTGFQVFSIFPYGGISPGSTYLVTVTGSGFQPGALVTIGGLSCLEVTNSGSSITCHVPTSLAPGSYNVVVTNPSGQALTVSPPFQVVTSGAPFISVDKNTSGVNFGSILAGSGAQVLSFTFMNTGTITAAASPSYPNADFSPMTFPGGAQCATALSANQSCYVNITFAPSLTGNRGGVASIFGTAMTFIGLGL